MNKNLNKIAQDLYGKIETRFPNIKIGDENAEVLSKKTDIPEARFFEFEYEEAGEKLGTIAITLDEEDGIIVQISGKLADSKHYGAFRFIRSFRQFAKNRLLKFHVQNIGKDHLDKRDYNFQAKPKEEPVMQSQQPVMESKMYGNARMSYQDLGEARLVIKHSQPVNPEIAAGRTMHIDSIYVENADGERFKYPFKHLNGARAMAEHLKHGGNPYDNIGKHISSLSEELSQLRKFKGYVTRNDTLAEAMNDITPRVMERIEEIKKEVAGLQRPTYYEVFAESFASREEQIIPEDVMSDWIDRLTIRTFNEDLKTAFPYIFRLVDETTIPVKELSPDDLLDENHHNADDENEKIEHLMRKYHWSRQEAIEHLHYNEHDPKDYEDMEEAQFESFINNIVTEAENEGHNDLFSPDVETRTQALDQLKNMMTGGKKLLAGQGGMNALSSIKGIIDSDYLNNELSALSGDDDAGSVIKTYLDKLGDGQIREPKAPKAKSIAQEIIASQVLNSTEGEEQPIGGEEMPLAPGAGAVPPAPAVPPEAGALPTDVTLPPPEELPPETGELPPPPAPVAESSGMARIKAKIIKAMECGAKPDDVLDFGHRTMTFAEACNACGIVPQQHSHEEPLKEIIKSIAGFFNPQKRNFTIGGTRCKIKVIKDFKNGAFKGATPHHVKKVITLIDKLDPSNQDDEMGRMRHLSGVKAHPGNPQDIKLSVAEEDQLQGFDVNSFIQQLTALSKNPSQIPAAMDAIGQKAPNLIKNGLDQVLQKVAQDAPDQDMDMPGVSMNPQKMIKGMQGAMGNMQHNESVGFQNEELSRIVSLVHHR